MIRPIALFSAATLAALPGLAFPAYFSNIPNGATVGCRTCHVENGSGEGWNAFGQDLLRQSPTVTEADLASADQNVNYAAGGVQPSWTPDLCGTDSDGDGQTNGEELGDPDCLWVVGAVPVRTTDIASPGDAASTSADPRGGAAEGEPAGEGEGEPAEGEGEVEQGLEAEEDSEASAGGCASTSSSGTPMAALALVLALVARRRLTRRCALPQT